MPKLCMPSQRMPTLLSCTPMLCMYVLQEVKKRQAKRVYQAKPSTTTRRYTVAHFRRFFTVLEYSPIGVKFSPTTAPRTLYTVKKKISKIFKTFLVLKVLVDINIFCEKKTFFDIKKNI
jgi:hypothetical protein